MNKFASFIVNHKKSVIIFYSVLVVITAIATTQVTVNYDLSSYLPTHVNSILGKNILEKDFHILGTANIMIYPDELPNIVQLEKDITSLNGVKRVVWLGSVEDINTPIEFMNQKTLENFYVDGNYLFQVQFSDHNDDNSTVSTVAKIEKLIENKGVIGGPAAVSKELRTIINKELIYYSIAAFVVILIILLLSMESFVEPILFFIGIGVAIVLNMGTNALFKSVSYTTNSVGSLIQLAVSMDYSIFLLHRYVEEKKKQEKSEAMITAIKKTFVSISASALTTIGGFIALTFMSFGIGRDLGIVLAKGVTFSLITVITLLPVLILIFDKQIEKYKRRSYFPRFRRLTPFVIKYRYVMLALALIVALPAFLAQNNVKYYYSDEKVLPQDAPPILADEKIDSLFHNKNQLALIIPRSNTEKAKEGLVAISAKFENQAGEVKEKEFLSKLEDLYSVKSVAGIYSLVDISVPVDIVPLEIRENFLTEDYSLINIVLRTPMEGEFTKKALSEIRELAKEYYPSYYLTGQSAILAQLNEVTSNDFFKVTIISIAIIGLIILLSFKSISIPVILVFIIQLGIWINLAIPYFLGNELNFIAFIIIGAIQLGATVDYAILYTSRFKENLELMPKIEAAKQTILDTGPAILTSALILFTATLSVSLITSIRNTSELTLLIGRGAIISLILVIGVLPAFLITFNTIIKKTTLNWPDEIKDRRH